MTEPRLNATWVTVGRVRGAFGIQGALKIEPFSPAESSVLLSSRHWMLIEEPPAGGSGVVHRIGARPFPLPAKVEIATVKAQGDAIIALLKSPLSREAANSLKGVAIQVDRSDFPVPEPGEYYWSDLIGCRVEDPTGAPLGTVSDIDDHGAQQVLHLDNGLLIPFVEAIVSEVLLEQRRIVADWSPDWA